MKWICDRAGLIGDGCGYVLDHSRNNGKMCNRSGSSKLDFPLICENDKTLSVGDDY